VRLVGALGVPCAALLREEHDGFTLVGEGIVDIVDAMRIEADLVALDAREREACPLPEPPWKDPKMVGRVGSYTCWDAGHQRAMPLVSTGAHWSSAPFSPEMIDGDIAQWAVTRITRVR
jgi:hypothetical protein